MKILKSNIILVLLFCFTANIHAQLITLKKTDVTIKELMSDIKKITGKRFFYHVDDINNEKKYTVDYKDQTLNAVLDNLFFTDEYSYKIDGDQIIISKPPVRKKTDNVITGKVTDMNGDPLIGVNVTSSVGTGTITNIDGNFSIKSNIGQSLTFTYVGYTSEMVTIKKQSFLTIKMSENAKMLNEVVVVGYGTQKKANLTGAVGYINGEELTNRPVASLGQALQGAVPNMNISFTSGKPGEATNLKVRGVGSINGFDNPLILVDGVESSIDIVNPRDVESISVLKDASSAAIYGARAAFGVVLITTKSADEGKTKVSYNGRFSFSKQTTRNDFLTTGYDAAMMVDEFMRSYNNTVHTKYSAADMEELKARRYDITENPDRPWVVEKNGRYMYYANFDWYNYLFDSTRPTWDHNLSFRGGNKKINYYVSGNYYTQQGIYNGDRPDRMKSINLRARINATVTSWLDFNLTSALNSKNYWAPGLGQGDNLPDCTFDAFPFLVPVNPDGTNVFSSQVIAGQPTGGVHIMIRDGGSFSENKQRTMTNTAGLTFKLYKGLKLQANYTYKYYNQDMVSRTNTGTFSQTPGKIEIAQGSLMKNKLRQTTNMNNLHVFDAFFSYDNSFGSHNVRGVVGANYESFYYKKIYATKLNIQSDILNDFNLGDNTSVLLGPEYNNGAGQAEYALFGIFGRLGYDYKGKYLAEFNIRRDASSRFPRHKRAGWFPSISAGWRVSDESFFEPVRSVISNLKIRGSYGALGNQKTNSYYTYIQEMSVMSMGNYILDGSVSSYTNPGYPPSSSLTWESIYSKNIGIDLGFFDGRLSFVGDLYHRDTKGMLMPGTQLPGVYGARVPMENGAELRTKGFEATIAWNDNFNLLRDKFSYSVSLSLADNTTKVTKYQTNTTNKLGEAYVGKEWGEIWGYQVDGLFATDQEAAEYASRISQELISPNIYVQAQGKYKGLQAGDLNYADLDGNGRIDNGLNTLDNHGDLKKIGNRFPRYTYSGNIGFSWYGVDFAAFFQGVGRQHIYPNGDAMLFWGGYARPYSSFVPKNFADDIWTPENPNAYFPKQRGYSAQGNRSLAQANDRYLQNLAYCRLKNITVGYTLPGKWTSKAKIERVRLYFSGENVATWTKLRSDYIDPEQFTSDGNARVYPFSKTFSFGIDITL